jgi:hypothetical protein
MFKTALDIDQKGGADGEPDQPIPKAAVTAVDGKVLRKPSRSTTWSIEERMVARSPTDYDQIFTGTGTGPNDRDASIQGTAYLTFTTVDNSTYNVPACLAFCDNVQGCVFVNLYYEYNNPGLDQGPSNLKCAAYGDIHTAQEKTNWGGQQLAPPPAGLTYIQQSGGWATKNLDSPAVPEGYELVFGPNDGANNAPGYMGFVFLERYDVAACAQECNKRGADPVGGACVYFNIWRAVVNGNPTTYTCSMYFVPTDASTATNTGQGDLKVTYSRGYKRKNYIIDGGFEGFTCPNNDEFCYATSYANWIGTSPPGGFLDGVIIHFQPYAHLGSSVGLLGAGAGTDTLSGTLTPAQPLQTVAGKKYVVGFFHSSSFSGPTYEAPAFVDIMWNGQIVKTIKPGYSDWLYYTVEVVAQGNDVLAFHGGVAPAWSFLDDISVFLE